MGNCCCSDSDLHLKCNHCSEILEEDNSTWCDLCQRWTCENCMIYCFKCCRLICPQHENLTPKNSYYCYQCIKDLR